MEAAEIGNTKFKERGALVLASSLEGPVVHALEEDADAQTLPTLQFDPALNEIVDIGSQIEVMDGSLESAHDVEDGGDAVYSVGRVSRFRHYYAVR
ncbi:hypothetical protein Q1695_013346 [Nippostrongylus brasiliensis]|nr:hypothetical protein Q1695_013346 [Nippostrongylus brasiliensis]